LALSNQKNKKEPSSENKYGEAPPKCLKSMIHLMMNLKKTQMMLSSPSSLAKSAKCGEIKVGLSGEALQEECPETRRTKTKAP